MNNFNILFNPGRKISRGRFAFLGFFLFALKYNIDRALASHFGVEWFFYNYFFSPSRLSVSELSTIDQRFYLLLVLISIPFLTFGLILSLQRLRDARIPLFLVFLFFIPLLNIFFFGMLSVIPGVEEEKAIENKPPFLDKLIPKSKTGSALFACGISVLLALAFTLFSVNLLREYGWGLFIAVPFFIGFTSVLLYAYHHQPVMFKEAVFIGFTGVIFFGILIFVLAMEGLICIAMAFPLAAVISFIGSLVAFSIQSIHIKQSLKIFSLNLLIVFSSLLIESKYDCKPEVIELSTSITIDQRPSKVWQQLIAFNEIAPPEEYIFRLGIAYPENATIYGKGVGAVRHCNFTTGAFIEPITHWDEPVRLSFNVLQQPVPMTELSFYKNVNAPHLEKFFSSLHGEFLLSETTDHKTLLTGTTWYTNKMWPAFYWKFWSDAILHKIHLRVLNHIKANSSS